MKGWILLISVAVLTSGCSRLNSLIGDKVPNLQVPVAANTAAPSSNIVSSPETHRDRTSQGKIVVQEIDVTKKHKKGFTEITGKLLNDTNVNLPSDTDNYRTLIIRFTFWDHYDRYVADAFASMITSDDSWKPGQINEFRLSTAVSRKSWAKYTLTITVYSPLQAAVQ